MEESEACGYDKHQQRIQNIRIRFFLKQRAVVALCVLNHAEYRPKHDQETGKIEHPEKLLPGDSSREGLQGGTPGNACVEDHCNDDEEAKGDNLNTEPEEDNFVAKILRRLSFSCGQYTTACAID